MEEQKKVNKEEVKMGGELSEFTKYVDTCIKHLLKSENNAFATTTACGASALIEHVLGHILSEHSPIFNLAEVGLISSKLADEELAEFLSLEHDVTEKSLMPDRTKKIKYGYYVGSNNPDNEDETIPYLVILEEHYETEGAFSKVFLRSLSAGAELAEKTEDTISAIQYIVSFLNIVLSGLETIYAATVYATISNDDCLDEALFEGEEEGNTDEYDDSMKNV